MSAAAAPKFSVPDRDLDDAELWALIDKAAASRKPLLALNNSPSPAGSHSPSPLKPFRNPRHQNPPTPAANPPAQDDLWSHHRPKKAARIGDHENRIVVLGNSNSPRTPLMALPPDQGRNRGKEVSPVVESPPSRSWGKEVSPVSMCGLSDSWQSEGKENMGHSLSGQFPSVSQFKQYQNAALAILEKTDYTMIYGNPFIKKSGWRKISFFFNISFEIKDRIIEFDDNRNVLRAEFVVRAQMRCGRFSDGWGSCDRREKRSQKPNHDVPSTAETRAKTKACSDLLGIGDYRSGVGKSP